MIRVIKYNRSSHPEVFLWKGVLKICSKFTGEHPCRSAISIKLQSNFCLNHTSAWVFSCKFAAHFQNTFSQEHLWMVASEYNKQQIFPIWWSWIFVNKTLLSNYDIFFKKFSSTCYIFIFFYSESSLIK